MTATQCAAIGTLTVFLGRSLVRSAVITDVNKIFAAEPCIMVGAYTRGGHHAFIGIMSLLEQSIGAVLGHQLRQRRRW